ncbi:DUF4296 domain-containing protein [Pseudofulvibacter geojedonensis]|uniref:DUF4296 domain-containing protein n=1 Tax=Pseudofulvibacter geojedonensis TaxID=1123758 RepID=A0ABW3I1S8_9FLAO
MKSYLLFLSFVLVLMSCDKVHKSPEPDNLLSQEKMVDIMCDIRLMNAARSKNYRKIKDSSVFIDKFVYHKYKIDSVTLRQNLNYYATNSFKTAKDIEFAVQQRLESIKKEVSEKIKVEDSLKLTKKKPAKLDLKKESFKSTKEGN